MSEAEKVISRPSTRSLGTLIPTTGTASQVRVLNRPNKTWLRIEDATSPDRLSLLINKEALLAALRVEGIIS